MDARRYDRRPRYADRRSDLGSRRPRTAPRPVGGKGFWWPSDGSHTKLTAFDRTVEEIDGAGDVAFVRGADSLRSLTRRAQASDVGERSVTLAVERRQPDGTWKIARMMWATVTH